jgi:hypothetical protein
MLAKTSESANSVGTMREHLPGMRLASTYQVHIVNQI